MSPPCISREPGGGRRLLWAFKDLLNYTIQLLFIRQRTAINQTPMFCSFSVGTMNLRNLFCLSHPGRCSRLTLTRELQRFPLWSRLNAPLHTVSLQVKLSVSSGPVSEFSKKHSHQRFTACVGEYYGSDISLKRVKADRFTDQSRLCIGYDWMMIWETDLCVWGGWGGEGASRALQNTVTDVLLFQG